jgi:hypothetical protein
MSLLIKAGAVMAAAWLASVASSLPGQLCGQGIGYDAFIATVGCGRVGNGADVRSETALIVAIRGGADIYTVRWAERGALMAKADVEAAKWQDPAEAPMKLCAIVAGEKAPYRSCIGKP